MKASILRDLSLEDYYADRLPGCSDPTLSSSIAKILLEKTPEQARLAHPRLRTPQETADAASRNDASDAKDAGSLIHRLVLGRGSSLAIVDAEDWRKQAAKDARDKARTEGKVPVLLRVYNEALLSARRIQERLRERGVVLDGESEVVLRWQEASSLDGSVVHCRAALDHLRLGQGWVTCIDLKSLESASADDCERHVADYNHDVQFAAYENALKSVFGEDIKLDFIFAFVERAAPNVVTVAELSEEAKKFGRMRWQLAVDKWATCMHLGIWRAYYSPERVKLNVAKWKMDEFFRNHRR